MKVEVDLNNAQYRRLNEYCMETQETREAALLRGTTEWLAVVARHLNLVDLTNRELSYHLSGGSG